MLTCILQLPLTFMTTVFTLPVLEFPRYDPESGNPDPKGLLRGNYVFSIIGEHHHFWRAAQYKVLILAAVGLTLALAMPLVMAAFKVHRLMTQWKKIKQWRWRVFPLHWAGKDGPRRDEGDPPVILRLGRFYYGGSPPRRQMTGGMWFWLACLLRSNMKKRVISFLAVLLSDKSDLIYVLSQL